MSSELVKEYDDCITIMLPDFSQSVVESFVKLLYTGETLIDSNLRDDFISLCAEMMVNVPRWDDCIKEEQFDVNEAEQIYEEIESSDLITSDAVEPASTGDEEYMNEYEITDEQHLELIENKTDYIEPSSLRETHHQVDRSEINNADQLTDQAFQENKSENNDFEFNNSIGFQVENSVRKRKIINKDRLKSRQSLQTQRYSEKIKDSKQKLQEAVEAVQCGLMTMEAARKYGVPKTTLYRKLQEAKKN